MHVSLQRLKTRFYFLKPCFRRWVRGPQRWDCVVCSLLMSRWASLVAPGLGFSLSPFNVVSVRTDPNLWDDRPPVTRADVFIGPQRSKAAVWYWNKCVWAFVRKSTLVAHPARCADALPSLWKCRNKHPGEQDEATALGGGVKFSFLD